MERPNFASMMTVQRQNINEDMCPSHHSKEYTNIPYMNHVGDLKQNIIDMDFANALPDKPDDARFKRHIDSCVA